LAASVEFTVVERRGARSEAEQAMVEVEREREREREMSQKVMEERRVGYENIYTESVV
jgi:hypothetical protein